MTKPDSDAFNLERKATSPAVTRHPADQAAATQGEAARPTAEALDRMVEAILFAAADPVDLEEMRARIPFDCDLAASLERLRTHYEGRGVCIARAGTGWAMRTAPDLGFLMQREVQKTRRLSRAALETLAIVAYHQPVTRAQIEEIRGVSVSPGTLSKLMDLGWVGLGRRLQVPGRPATFIVTRHFLDHFGLESAADLPGMKELKQSGLL